MKGRILAGGSGTRLRPLTKIISKHLLPVFDTLMIFYPVKTLIKVGIEEILLVVNADHINQYFTLLGFGEELGVKID